MINYLEAPLGYLLRIPCGDHAADSPLDEPARDRAEQAAAFLRYERIGRIFCAAQTAAQETAQMVWLGCSMDYTDAIAASGLEDFWKFLQDPDRSSLPCVFVSTQGDIAYALSANVCTELVAPGGVISLHRDEGKIVPRARHMILDFGFTDLEKAVAWKETTPCSS